MDHHRREGTVAEFNQGSAGAASGAASGAMSADDRNMCILVHVLGIFTQFVGPLIIWLIKKDQSPVVAKHAVEVINFWITLAIAFFACFILVFIIIGIFLMPLVMIWALVNLILGALAASKGQFRPYPLTLRLLK
jgi:hypothetical protein